MRILALVPPSRDRVNIARDLLYGCWCWGRRIGGAKFPPLTTVQVATVLQQDSFDVALIDADACGMDSDALSKEALSYDIVILLTSSLTIAHDATVLSTLKAANPRLKSIIFGNYPSAQPREALSFSGIDIVVRNEPEYIIRDLLRSFDNGSQQWKQIPGISFLDNAEVAHNPDYPYIEDLNELPFPDRTLLPKDAVYFNPLVKALPYTTIYTSRGCHGRCVFCCSPLFYGKKIRHKSSANVIEELKAIKKLGYREVFFRDENFTFPKERTVDICLKIIKEKLDLKWICSSRADLFDYETAALMKEAGCHMIRIGVESGAQELLDNIRKDLSLEQIRQAFILANKLKIDTHAHFMIGVPGETESTVRATREFAKTLNPTVVTFGILIPYPGTPIFEVLPGEVVGISASLDKSYGSLRQSKHLSGIPEDKLISYVRGCYRDFYLRPRYLLKRLTKINNFNELWRTLLAGSRVWGFIFGEEY